MIFAKPRRSPVDYSKCNQTVTIYHQEGIEYIRRVCNRAFLDFRKTLSTDKTGRRESNSFLLVIPCSEQIVFEGDKVLLGIGPEVATAADWRELIPAKMPGLVEVQYADPKYFEGRMIHVEAGG